MAAKGDPAPKSGDLEIHLERWFEAPRALVFKAWTEPKHMVRWFGPNDFTSPSAEVDLRVGGRWRICIRAPGGQDYWMHGVYHEVARPERLVFTHIWEEGHDSPNHQTLVTIVFEDHGKRTRMLFHKAVLESVKERMSQTKGWSECLDRLVAYVGDIKDEEARDGEAR